MNRGRGRFTPSPSGRGRGGWSRSSPSSGGSSDLPNQTHAGADPSSPDHISSGGSGERSRHRNDRFRGGRQMSDESKSVWKPVQPDAYKASAGEGCSPSSGGDRTDCEVTSPELSHRFEIVGSGLIQSDMSTECTKKGSADRSPKGNYESPHGNSSGSSGRSSQGNGRPRGVRQPQPIVPSISRDRTICEITAVTSPELNYRAEIVGGDLRQSEKSDLSSECTKKGSADRSRRGNYGSPHGNSSGSSGRSSQGNERPSDGSGQWYNDGKQPQPVVPISRDRTISEVTSLELNYRAEIVGDDIMQSEKSDLFSDCTEKGSFDEPLGLNPSLTKNRGSLHAKSSFSSKRSSQKNEWTSSQRRTSQQHDTGWVEAKPVAYKYSKQSEVPDLSSDCTVKNRDSHCEKSSASTEYTAHKSLSGSKNTNECDSSQPSDCVPDAELFDICPSKAGVHVVLKQSLLEKNRERRKETGIAMEPKETLLGSGMVLLKNFISLSDQVIVVNKCRELGLGVGGFYQPRYRDGAKLSLRMMCLGKNWDPETRSYGEIRSIDDAKPPPIPSYFLELVERSIKDSRALIAKECGSTERAEDILPWMSPDICLVNFYTTGGRLGLHQDRDESQKSLEKGLPVVSISIGDWAEFLYGDEREVDKAEKVTLESGDVLIFGGESRHVFHGISSVKPDTAPKPLLKETNLRPGRLNLTFRQY